MPAESQFFNRHLNFVWVSLCLFQDFVSNLTRLEITKLFKQRLYPATRIASSSAAHPQTATSAKYSEEIN